jgi:sirohydrochlorin ferrochelatase
VSPLVIAAHGSADRRFADIVELIVRRVRLLRPGLDVQVGYLEHGPPHLADVAAGGSVAVPLLLSSGFHARVDLPAQAPGARVARAVGPDGRLAAALAERLADAGYDGQSPVVLAAAGSADERALADVRSMAALLAARLGADVTAAFVSAGEPRVADIVPPGAASPEPRAVASYLLAPGVFHDNLAALDADVVSAPIGDHPTVAQLVLDRYDEVVVPAAPSGTAHTPGRTAPA